MACRILRDKRTDIWAFACVVFEMLTSASAFRGEDVTEVLAAVVMKEPALETLPSSTPPAIRMLLRRCFRKDRRDRLPDAGAARIEIQDAITASAARDAAACRSSMSDLIPVTRGSLTLREIFEHA